MSIDAYLINGNLGCHKLKSLEENRQELIDHLISCRRNSIEAINSLSVDRKLELIGEAVNHYREAEEMGPTQNGLITEQVTDIANEAMRDLKRAKIDLKNWL